MLDEIKRFCRAKQISWNRFGTLAVSDGNLVLQMEGGRKLSDHTASRVRAFMNENVDTEFAYNTLQASTPAPRINYDANREEYAGSTAFVDMVETGTKALHKALWRHHAGILEALERQGNGRVVVRP